ncbi:zinc ribbon domain-containing protein [Planctomicrobium piriforme]|uniref:C4-type zinc ribbon domain-containing protein n=1 Tax=Planctomicrobium piriforme TaxID=1576369 RepID=A0A1I3G044_9PLAN|nr:hypothetical protein [Planctomicrobium piriforme]SFI16777.1 hypothetical protein SAMN05421753_106111 [Planctomicrobium piriforme]
MASVAAQFNHLHSLLVQLKEAQDHLIKGPRQIKARQARVTEAEQQLAVKEQEWKDARATVDRKNLDLRSKESHLNDLQGKLNTASSNREYDIIRGQTGADQAAKAVLEDEILEWLDRVDVLQREVAECKLLIKQVQDDAHKFANDFETKASGLMQQEEELKKQIAEAEKIIPKDFYAQYRRLVEAYGAEGLASSENGMCNQCYVGITPQNRVLLNSGKLLFCSVCGRLLYPFDREAH